MICFSLLFLLLTGCAHTASTFSPEWQLPPSPETTHIEFVEVKDSAEFEDGWYLSEKEAKDLANNVDELKAYIKKLEVLVEKMQDHYE